MATAKYGMRVVGEDGGEVWLKPGDAVPSWATVTNKAALEADDESEQGDSGDGDQDEGYGDMTVTELKAEIAARNEGRDEADQIPDEGKKADLIAALEADDEG